MFIQIVYQKSNIQNVYVPDSIGISGFDRVGGVCMFIEIVYEISNIEGVYDVVAVGITANIGNRY